MRRGITADEMQALVAKSVPPSIREKITKCDLGDDLGVRLKSDLRIIYLQNTLDIRGLLEHELLNLPGFGEEKVRTLLNHGTPKSLFLLCWARTMQQIMTYPDALKEIEVLGTRLDRLEYRIGNLPEAPAKKRLFTNKDIRTLRDWAAPWYPKEPYRPVDDNF